MDEREAGAPVRGVHEAARHERREAELVGAALRGQAPVDDGERALRVRAASPAPAAGSAPAAGGHGTDCPARCARGGTVRRCGAPGSCAPRPARSRRRAGEHERSSPIGVRRPSVRRVDAHAGAHGAGLERGDVDALGMVDEQILGGRGVVVGVAAVAAVDESSEAAHREAVGRRDCVRAVAVDLDVEMLVVERRRPCCNGRRRPVPGGDRVAAPAEARARRRRRRSPPAPAPP